MEETTVEKVVVVEKAPGNGLGTAGFVLALLGLVMAAL